MSRLFTLTLLLLLSASAGSSQTNFVELQFVGSTDTVCQGKSLAIIATLIGRYNHYTSYEWGGNTANYIKVHNELALVNTQTPGSKALQFTLHIDSLTRRDTLTTVHILPKPDITLLQSEKGEIEVRVHGHTPIKRYVWTLNREIITNQTSHSIPKPQPGTYRVLVTDMYGCTAASDSLVVNKRDSKN